MPVPARDNVEHIVYILFALLGWRVHACVRVCMCASGVRAMQCVVVGEGEKKGECELPCTLVGNRSSSSLPDCTYDIQSIACFIW